MDHTLRRWARWAGIGVMAVLLSACMLRTEVEVSIDSDGSGTVIQTVLYDDEFVQLFGAAEEFAEQLELDASVDADVEILSGREVQDPYTNGVRSRSSFSDARELELILRDGLFDQVTVTIDGDALAIRGRVDGEGDDFDMPGMGPELSGEIVISVDGSIDSSDADSVSGGTATWELDLAVDNTITLDATLGGDRKSVV